MLQSLLTKLLFCLSPVTRLAQKLTSWLTAGVPITRCLAAATSNYNGLAVSLSAECYPFNQAKTNQGEHRTSAQSSCRAFKGGEKEG